MANGTAAEIGQRLKAAIVLRGTTAEDLGQAVGFSPATLGRIMQGRRQAKDFELELFARELDVPAWFLLGGLPPDRGPDGHPPASELADLAAARHDELLTRLDAIAEAQRVLMARLEETRRPI